MFPSYPLLRSWIFAPLIFSCFLAQSQGPVPLPHLIDKTYLSPEGRYLKFLTGEQALFNQDTVQYRLVADTLHLVASYTWIGEQRHSFSEEFVYQVRVGEEGVQLISLRLPYGDTSKAEVLLLRDIDRIPAKRSRFRSFSITRQLYLTSGGEWDAEGPVRSDTVYTVTTATLYADKRLIKEVKHLRVTHGPQGSTRKYAPLSRTIVKLSRAAYQQKLLELDQAYLFFMQDHPCTGSSIHYQFRYKTATKTHVYTKCWLNRLELALAGWVD